MDEINLCFIYILLGVLLAVAITGCSSLIVSATAQRDYKFIEERVLIEQADGIYFETILTDSGTLVAEYEYNSEFGITIDTINLYDTLTKELYRQPVEKGKPASIEIYSIDYVNENLRSWFWLGDPIEEDRLIVHYNEDMVKEYKSCLD
jgi:hypothetical protein